MQAYLIDPVAKEIRPVDFDGDYKSICRLIDCRTFTVVEIEGTGDPADIVFVDDEGLLNDPHFFFMLDSYPQPLAGFGLVLGTDDDGESVSPRITLEELTRRVSYRQLRVKGFRDLTMKEREAIARDHPLGVMADNVIGHRPIFETDDN